MRGEGSVATRFLKWESVAEAIADKPVLGTGPDTLKQAYLPHETAEILKIAGRTASADNAHSYPLQLAATLGVAGALLWLVAFLAPLVTSWRSALRAPTEARVLIAGLVGGIAGYFVYLLFGLSVVGSMGVAWVFVGALAGMGASGVALRTAAAKLAIVTASLVAGLALLASAAILLRHRGHLLPS